MHVREPSTVEQSQEQGPSPKSICTTEKTTLSCQLGCSQSKDPLAARAHEIRPGPLRPWKALEQVAPTPNHAHWAGHMCHRMNFKGAHLKISGRRRAFLTTIPTYTLLARWDALWPPLLFATTPLQNRTQWGTVLLVGLISKPCTSAWCRVCAASSLTAANLDWQLKMFV